MWLFIDIDFFCRRFFCTNQQLVQFGIRLCNAQLAAERLVTKALCDGRKRCQIALAFVKWHQQGEQNVYWLVVRRVKADGLFQRNKNADGAGSVFFQLAVGIATPAPMPVVPMRSRLRMASNTVAVGIFSCSAASSLMISSARFLLEQ